MWFFVVSALVVVGEVVILLRRTWLGAACGRRAVLVASLCVLGARSWWSLYVPCGVVLSDC